MDAERDNDIQAAFNWQENNQILEWAPAPFTNLLNHHEGSGFGDAFWCYCGEQSERLAGAITSIKLQSQSVESFNSRKAATRLEAEIQSIKKLCDDISEQLKFEEDRLEDILRCGRHYAYERNAGLSYPQQSIVNGMFEYGREKTGRYCAALKRELEKEIAERDNEEIGYLSDLLCMGDRFNFLTLSGMKYYQQTAYEGLPFQDAFALVRESNERVIGLLSQADNKYAASACDRQKKLAEMNS